jgi:hypothetical protein
MSIPSEHLNQITDEIEHDASDTHWVIVICVRFHVAFET